MSEMNKEKVDVNVDVTDSEVIVPAQEPFYSETEVSEEGPKGSGIVAGLAVGAGVLTGLYVGGRALYNKFAKKAADQEEGSEEKPKKAKKKWFKRVGYAKVPLDEYEWMLDHIYVDEEEQEAAREHFKKEEQEAADEDNK